MAWFEAQKMKQAITEKRQDLIEELTPNHLDERGFPKASLINDVNRRMMKEGQKIQDKTAYKLREIQELNASKPDLERLDDVPKGTPLTAKRAKALVEKYGKDRAIQAAKKLGYTIPDRSSINEE